MPAPGGAGEECDREPKGRRREWEPAVEAAASSDVGLQENRLTRKSRSAPPKAPLPKHKPRRTLRALSDRRHVFHRDACIEALERTQQILSAKPEED
jgi:hypothetical protein